MLDPKSIAERGERIYADKYKIEYEANHRGKFVAIDVQTERAYLGSSPEEAYELARQDTPHGFFHLVRVGERGAYRVGYISNARDWNLR